ncbi:MAG: aminoacyl-tRNA hydrolase [Sandaracinobacteroides sp.]
MLVFAGLGNPGPAYAQHRHNVGFMAADAIARAHEFAPWKARFQGLAAEGRIGSAKLLLLKPMTFMNESGRSVGDALRFFKLDAGALTVFHDELDLEPFRVKVKTGGGAAGQNGLRSIIAHVGADFRRVRIGIGHPGHKDRVTPHVLGNFVRAEEQPLLNLLGDIADLAPRLAEGDDARFMSDLALRQAAAP